MRMAAEAAELSHRQAVRRHRALRQEGERLGDRSCRDRSDRFAVEIDRAGRRLDDARHRAQQGRLAAAVCAYQGRDFPIRYREIDIAKYRGCGIADGNFFTAKACRMGFSHGDLSP